MLTRFYDWMLRLSARRHAPAIMGLVSFLDSSMLPIPPHPFLALLVMARPQRAYLWALVCTMSSVVGGFLGYAIGGVLYDYLGDWLVRTYGYEQQIAAFREMFAEWGFWIIVIKGLTPIPFKIVTIGSGIAEYPLLPFFFASIVSRGIQFYAIAWLLRHRGSQIDQFARRYGNVLGWSVAVLVVAIIVYRQYF